MASFVCCSSRSILALVSASVTWASASRSAPESLARACVCSFCLASSSMRVPSGVGVELHRDLRYRLSCRATPRCLPRRADASGAATAVVRAAAPGSARRASGRVCGTHAACPG
eukprot:11193314-Lingulodinium_polyedra.AAC.1